MYIYPTYTALYGGKLPTIPELLKEFHLSSNILLKCALYINAQLVNNPNEQSVQEFLINIFLKRIPKSDRFILTTFMEKVQSEGDHVSVFNRFCIIELIHQLLKYYVNEPILRDSTPEEELLFFKIILISNELRTLSDNKNIEKNYTDKKDKNTLFFQKMHWAILVNQIESVSGLDFFYESFRAMSILRFLEKDIDTHPYMKRYLMQKKVKNSWQFVFNFLNIYTLSFKSSKLGEIRFSFETDESHFEFLEGLCVNINEYRNNIKLHKHYIGIKSKPLLKENKTYYVLDWQYFCDQLYIGFLFDFYEKSGIKIKYKDFGDFKSFVGGYISEKAFFNPIMREIYENKKGITFYDRDGKDGAMPDFYLRQGKYIFLFEFKDNLMADSIKEDYSFDKVKESIDNIFVRSKSGRNKALYQISNYIESIYNNNFSKFDNLDTIKIKNNNLIIYPIIIYTDSKYSFPGLNDYLDRTFREIIIEKQIIKTENIKKISFIDFKFFFLNAMKLKKKDLDLKTLIDNYHKKIRKDEKRHKKKPTIKKFELLYQSFETIYYRYFPNKPEEESLEIFINKLGLLDINFDLNNEEDDYLDN